jgi:hypothetical protein
MLSPPDRRTLSQRRNSDRPVPLESGLPCLTPATPRRVNSISCVLSSLDRIDGCTAPGEHTSAGRRQLPTLLQMQTAADVLRQSLPLLPGDQRCWSGGIRTGRLPGGAGSIARYRRLRAYSDHRQRELRSAADVKRPVDMTQVHLHGGFGHMQFAGDFLVVQALRYEPGDFSFARRQGARNLWAPFRHLQIVQ